MSSGFVFIKIMNIFELETRLPTSLESTSAIKYFSHVQYFFPTASLLTCDGRVYFVSKNFYNILHWDPVEPAFPGEKVLYSVRYWR